MKYTEMEKTTIRRAARVLVDRARGLVDDLDNYLDQYGYTGGVVAEYAGEAMDDIHDALGDLFALLSFDMACDAMAAAVDLLYQ